MIHIHMYYILIERCLQSFFCPEGTKDHSLEFGPFRNYLVSQVNDYVTAVARLIIKLMSQTYNVLSCFERLNIEYFRFIANIFTFLGEGGVSGEFSGTLKLPRDSGDE